MKLPKAIAERVQLVLDALPLQQAMAQLVVKHGASRELKTLVESTIASPELSSNEALCAGLWLYVDELDRSHVISQGIEDATGSYWHGIMHRREGDFSNSHYWFHRVGNHPAMKKIDGYDAHRFIDEVEGQHVNSPAALIDLQRREWVALFEWCAEHSGK
ncbi:MAG: hypothetical protein IT366_06705 [Candidatus Hydrogenedentes bacterium]|nr:hypothetical protein [Candidatus Hydrogenedentota bacterium]